MDLNAPLGQGRPPSRSSRTWPLVAGAVIAIALMIGAGIALYRGDPHGGEPYAVALVPPPPAPSPIKPTPAAPDTTPTGSIATTPSDSIRMENGVKVVSPQASDVPRQRDTGPLVIDVSKALDEKARKIAARDKPGNNALPAVNKGAQKPRIAIVVGGLGLSESATRTAIETMPPGVSFAFVPTGGSLVPSVDAAKAKGHEILLQIPMENAKGVTTGPHTLRTTAPAAELTRDLAWLTSRFDGYVGVVNFLGAPVTANPSTMTAVLKAVAQKNAFYLDDGTSKRSIAASLGTGLGVPTIQTDVVLDATPDAAVVWANLERLASTAKAKGFAIGMASGLTDHLSAVARFAGELDARGFTLVPVSAVARSNGSVATAR